VEDRAAFSATWFWNGRFFYFIFISTLTITLVRALLFWIYDFFS